VTDDISHFDARGVSVPGETETAVAIDRLRSVACGLAIREVYRGHWRIGLSFRADLQMLLSEANQAALGPTVRHLKPAAWRIENLILPGVTFTEDARYADILSAETYEGRPTSRVTPLYGDNRVKP